MTPYQASENEDDPAVTEVKQDMLPPESEDTVQPVLRKSQHQVTGEHPPVRATSTDHDVLPPVLAGDEILSANLHNQEPEDTLPDYLDQHR